MWIDLDIGKGVRALINLDKARIVVMWDVEKGVTFLETKRRVIRLDDAEGWIYTKISDIVNACRI